MTKHNSCTMAFGKPSKHANCPRCEELKQGTVVSNLNAGLYVRPLNGEVVCLFLSVVCG